METEYLFIKKKNNKMGASKNIFGKQREHEEYEKFDHDKRFKEKQKFTWFTTEDMRECLSMNLFKLTHTLIKFSKEGYKIDYQDYDRLIELIDKAEPIHIGKSQVEYFKLVLKTPLSNMKRFLEKYTNNLTFTMTHSYTEFFKSEVNKKINNDSK